MSMQSGMTGVSGPAYGYADNQYFPPPMIHEDMEDTSAAEFYAQGQERIHNMRPMFSPGVQGALGGPAYAQLVNGFGVRGSNDQFPPPVNVPQTLMMSQPIEPPPPITQTQPSNPPGAIRGLGAASYNLPPASGLLPPTEWRPGVQAAHYLRTENLGDSEVRAMKQNYRPAGLSQSGR